MEQAVRELFARYEAFFRKALAGEMDAAQMRAEARRLYAPAFVGATPAGVVSGRMGAKFLRGMAEGYEHYRRIGTRKMKIRHLRVEPVDEWHAMAHVGWAATYARDDLAETKIDFEVHYLVQVLDGKARIFGWMSGDEEAVLKSHGAI